MEEPGLDARLLVSRENGEAKGPSMSKCDSIGVVRFSFDVGFDSVLRLRGSFATWERLEVGGDFSGEFDKSSGTGLSEATGSVAFRFVLSSLFSPLVSLAVSISGMSSHSIERLVSWLLPVV